MVRIKSKAFKVHCVIYGVSRLRYSFCYQGRAKNHIKKNFMVAHSPANSSEQQPPATLIVTLISLYNIVETTSQFKHDARIMQIATTIRGVWY